MTRQSYIIGAGGDRALLAPGLTLYAIGADPAGQLRLDVDHEQFRAWLLGLAPAPDRCPHPGHVHELLASAPGGWCVDCRGWWTLDPERPDVLVFRLVLPRELGAATVSDTTMGGKTIRVPMPPAYAEGPLNVAHVRAGDSIVGDIVDDLVRDVRREFRRLTGRDE